MALISEKNEYGRAAGDCKNARRGRRALWRWRARGPRELYTYGRITEMKLQAGESESARHSIREARKANRVRSTPQPEDGL